jgi:hyperosmotically inducible periplasmic protein
MKKMQRRMSQTFLALVVAMGLISVSTPMLNAQDSATKPDNSAQNKKPGTTSDNQPNASADRQLAATIRKTIVADKDLSTYAHNVKVIVSGGMVTLKGPVKSEEEKQKVKNDVATVADPSKIDDQLTVAK